MIQPGDRGVDFLYGLPSPASLTAKGIRFAALYLKRWAPDYVASLHAAGIAVLPIVETTPTMMLGGATAGLTIAAKAVDDCRRFGVPEGTTIIFAHDTSTMSSAVVDFNFAAHHKVRAERFCYGGYGGRYYFDQCMAAGVRFDLIWATNARAWLGGRHPDAHCWQGTYGDGATGAYDTVDGVAVDKNVCTRTFAALVWGSPTQIPMEDDDMPIVTNAEQFFADPPLRVKFAVMDDGRLRHLGESEWIARGSVAGTPLSNAQINELGQWTPPVVPPSNAPVVFPTYGGNITSVPGPVTLTPV